MSYLVDSDWLIDALAGIESAVTTLDGLSEQGLSVSIVAVGEVYEGAFGFPDPPSVLAMFREFLSDYVTVPLSDQIVEEFARLRAALRSQGLPIPDLDLLIAATAIAHGLVLITRNRRHFERIPDLRLFAGT